MDVRSAVEKHLGQAIPEHVWEFLISSQPFVKKWRAAEKADGVSRASYVMSLAFAAEVEMGIDLFAGRGVDYEDSECAQERKPHKKPSAQARYKAMLDHVCFEAVRQYTIRKGFARQSSTGKTIIDNFDLPFHSRWIFTPDVDFAAIYARWNELHPDDLVPTKEAFKKTCQRCPSRDAAVPLPGTAVAHHCSRR